MEKTNSPKYGTCDYCGNNCKKHYKVCSRSKCRARAKADGDAIQETRDSQANNRRNWRSDMHIGQDKERDLRVYGEY